jgi:uncharacterized protein (DUF3084 family)
MGEEQRQISSTELNGRILAIQAQRNSAMDQVAALAGENALLQTQLKEAMRRLTKAKAKIDQLEPPAQSTKPCRGAEGLVFPSAGGAPTGWSGED